MQNIDGPKIGFDLFLPNIRPEVRIGWVVVCSTVNTRGLGFPRGNAGLEDGPTDCSIRGIARAEGREGWPKQHLGRRRSLRRESCDDFYAVDFSPTVGGRRWSKTTIFRCLIFRPVAPLPKREIPRLLCDCEIKRGTLLLSVRTSSFQKVNVHSCLDTKMHKKR